MASIEYLGLDKKKENHRYRVIISLGYDHNDRQIKARESVKIPVSLSEKARLKEINKLAASLENKYQGNELVAAKKYNVRDFAKYYLENEVQDKLKQRTYFGYKQNLIIVCKYIGHHKIDKVTAAILHNMFLQMKHDKVKLSIMDHCFSALSAMFSSAVRMQYISVNPCKQISSPKSSKSRKSERIQKLKFLNVDQARVLVKYFDEEPLKYKLAFNLALFVGIRRSEINGLEWSDFDFDNNTISIRRQSHYSPDVGIYSDTPKTNSSVRIINAPEDLMKIAQKYKVEWDEIQKTIPDELLSNIVFIKNQGGPIYPDTIANRFRKMLRKIEKCQSQDGNTEAKIPKGISFHSLRHTCASLRSSMGENIIDVGAFLGHADKSSTMIYLHALNDRQKQITDQMSNLINDTSSIDEKP